MYKIEDEIHAEFLEGEFDSFEKALIELKRIAIIPWDQEPNLPPCTSWKTCERNYNIVEYDISKSPWKEIDRQEILKISAKGICWMKKNI